MRGFKYGAHNLYVSIILIETVFLLRNISGVC